jgi:phage gp36-like protein
MTQTIMQPGEKPILPIDFTPQIGAAVISQILNVSIEARGQVAQVTALTVAEQAFDGQEVRLKLQGGTDGELYLVTVTVRDGGGQEATTDFEVAVVDLRWTVPDGTTPYLTIAEFVTHVGLEETLQLTDAGTGRVGKARLISAIIDAQAVADGYLAGRYTVPLAEAPQLVKAAVRAMARASLYRDELPFNVKAAADQAVKTLERLSSGAMKLPQAEEPAAAPETTTTIVSHTGGRAYPPGALDAF